MSDVVLGPMLRHVGERDATVWVEADAPCEVEVLGRRARTFTVHDRHYALVVIEGLEPGGVYEYGVALDGERRWPRPGDGRPPPVIRTVDPARALEVAFGSCRVALPHEPPYTLSKDEHELGAEVCALRVRALEMQRQPRSRRPDLLLMLGDQVYVDEGAPRTRALIRARRDTSRPPGDGPLDYEEYASLYAESWSEPELRWLFSVVPTAMISDDHDVHDDWNISRVWLAEMEARAWWHSRIRAALASYWVYQHLGNLAPERLAREELPRRVLRGGDATEPIERLAARAARDRRGIRWSYERELGRSRLVVMDSRIGRVLTEGQRSIVDDEEAAWLDRVVRGGVDHLLLATSDPLLLAHGMHFLEAWSEAVGDGAWGPAAARLAERLRRALDLDHWAAFIRSFDLLCDLMREVAAGERGEPPATVVVLSGDVHHAYLAEVGFPRGSGARTAVYQAVCSPYRNPLGDRERLAIRASASRPARLAARALARLAGAAEPRVGWRFLEGPYFDNQVATLRLDRRSAELRLEKTRPGERAEQRLETSFSRRLA